VIVDRCPFCAIVSGDHTPERVGREGISLRQNNRPTGGQEVAHYHLHVTPRYRGDGGAPNSTGKTAMDAAERTRYAVELRDRCERWMCEDRMIEVCPDKIAWRR